MDSYKVIILPAAREDIVEIYLYIAADNPASALAIANNITDTIDTLAKFRLIGRIVLDNELAKQEFRMLVISSYIAFYRILNDEVVVYRVLYGSRNYPHLLQ